MLDVNWQTKRFEELTNHELFDILKLRQAIFVVEQECAYPDIDDTDIVALHFSGFIDEQLAAYARLIKPGVTYEYASLGRIVVAQQYRGSGLGRILMLAAIEKLEEYYPGERQKIGAQQHLESFYNSLGFNTVSDMNLEDGIPHIDMLRDASS